MHLLQLAASLENSSEHPIARAIVQEVERQNIQLLSTQDFNSVTGKGITGNVNSHTVAIGNLGLLESLGIKPEALKERAEALRADGATVILIAIDEKPAGLISVAGPIKKTTKSAIEALHKEGLKVVMLTGDNATTLPMQ